MDVLEDPERVVGGHDAQVLLHLVVPDPREVLDGDRAVEEALLDLEAHANVERVGELVGVHADQAVDKDLVHEVVEVGVGAVGSLRQVLAEDRAAVSPERLGLANHALPEQGLTLVDAHRQGLAHREPLLLGVPPLLVQRVAGLVDDPHDLNVAGGGRRGGGEAR